MPDYVVKHPDENQVVASTVRFGCTLSVTLKLRDEKEEEEVGLVRPDGFICAECDSSDLYGLLLKDDRHRDDRDTESQDITYTPLDLEYLGFYDAQLRKFYEQVCSDFQWPFTSERLWENRLDERWEPNYLDCISWFEFDKSHLELPKPDIKAT